MYTYSFFYFILFLLSFVLSTNAAEVYSVKKNNERLEAFKSLTSIKNKGEIAFKVVSEISGKENFSVIYSFNGRRSELFKGSIEKKRMVKHRKN